MPAEAVTLAQIVTEVSKSLNFEGRMAKLDADVAAVSALNDRMKAIEGGATENRDLLDEAVKELKDVRDRMKRLAQFREQAGFEDGAPYRVDARGHVVPQISRECAEFVRDAIFVNVPGYREFVKSRLNRDVSDLSVFSRDTTQLNSGANTVGGFLIPPQYRPELLKLLTVYGQARKLFRFIPMETDSLTMPALDGEMDVYEIDENAAPTESKPTVALFTLTTKIYGALTHIPLKLAMQSNPAIVQIVVEAIFRAFARKEDVLGFTGLKTGGDAFNGILNTPTSGNTNSRGNATAYVLADTKTHVSDVDFDDFRKAIDATPTPALTGAAWIIHRTIGSHLRGLRDTTGRFIGSDPFIDAANGQPARIWGYPVIEVEAMPALTTTVTASKKFAVLANPAVMALGDQQAPTVAQDNSIGFKEGQIWVRGTEMVGFEATIKDAVTVLQTAAS